MLARAEAFASRQPIGHALLDGLAMGSGFLVVLVALGSVREVLGRGSLGGDLHVLLGTDAPSSGLHLFGEQHGFLLALLPPGAFILLGLGLAWRQARAAQPQRPHRVPSTARPARPRVKPAQVRELFERLQALNPNPVTELEHSTPFELLVAVILSAQATDKGVNIATRKLFPVANTPEKILALGADGLTVAT